MSETMTKEGIREWEERVLHPILNGEMPFQEDVAEFGGIALLSADTDKIKEYVFESAKLPEIRGGSMILDALNQGDLDDDGENLRKLFAEEGFRVERSNENSCIIYAGGGSLLAIVPLEIANELKQEIEALYPSLTGSATITCIFRSITLADLQSDTALSGRLSELQNNLPDAYQTRLAGYATRFEKAPSPFSRLMQIQATELRREKEEKTTVPVFESVPYARRCESCGRRSANSFEQDPPPGRYLCQVCQMKAGRAKPEKSGLSERRERKFKWHDEYTEMTGIQVDVPRDLDEIGRTSNRYVGLIYTDGDGVGSRLEKTLSLSDYRSRSTSLVTAMKNAVYASIQSNDIRDFEIITIGGDDALLIVPANKAFRTALDICNSFGKELKPEQWDNQPPTMSAGVVIAHQDNPINFLFRTAEDLLKNAKKKSHESGIGAVDFLIFKSQSMLSTNLKHLRASPPLYFSPNGGKERLFLTARPYTLNDMGTLLKTACTLKQAGFGQSWLKNLSFNLSRGRLAASIYYLYQYARQPDPQQKVLSDLQTDWGMGQNNGWLHAAPPWRLKGERNKHREFDTPWPDFIEVMEFLPDEEGG